MTENCPLAITMGDASGIGPEIVAKALAGVVRTCGQIAATCLEVCARDREAAIVGVA